MPFDDERQFPARGEGFVPHKEGELRCPPMRIPIHSTRPRWAGWNVGSPTSIALLIVQFAGAVRGSQMSVRMSRTDAALLVRLGWMALCALICLAFPAHAQDTAQGQAAYTSATPPPAT